MFIELFLYSRHLAKLFLSPASLINFSTTPRGALLYWVMNTSCCYKYLRIWKAYFSAVFLACLPSMRWLKDPGCFHGTAAPWEEREGMERTHGLLPHLGPEGTCITSIHIPQPHGQSHCKGCWEIQRRSRILISIEVTATVIICPILQLKKQRIRGMQTWPNTLQLAWVGDQFKPRSICLQDHPLSHCLLTVHHRGQRPETLLSGRKDPTLGWAHSLDNPHSG